MASQIKKQTIIIILLFVFGVLTIVAGVKCLITHSTSSYLFILLLVDNLLLIINLVLLIKNKKNI